MTAVSNETIASAAKQVDTRCVFLPAVRAPARCRSLPGLESQVWPCALESATAAQARSTQHVQVAHNTCAKLICLLLSCARAAGLLLQGGVRSAHAACSPPSGADSRPPPCLQTLVMPTMSRHMNMTEQQAKSTWGKLEAAIEKIHEQNASSLSFEELYRYAYNMVLHRWAPMLYAGMENSLRDHLAQVTKELETYTDMAFMRQLLLKWSMYHKSTQLIRDILMARSPLREPLAYPTSCVSLGSACAFSCCAMQPCFPCGRVVCSHLMAAEPCWTQAAV
jgi:Cullin family